MPSPLIRRLADLDASHAGAAGGKGASLGELHRAGAPVPPAFVIDRSAFDRFLTAADPEHRVDRWLADVDAGRLAFADATRAILGLLAPVPVPDTVGSALADAFRELGAERVSVRSSATCEDGDATAWAGQLQTFLNVARADLEARVKDCWLSIFAPAPLAYGAAHGYGAGQFGVAVVVQQMVASEISGIGFSVHPVTQEPGVQLVEACLGLGEAIVSGAISPDQYVMQASPPRILEHAAGEQRKGLFLDPGTPQPVWRELAADRRAAPKLTEAQALEYAQILARIERHYGRPMDTEWALTAAGFHLLQARPITTLAREYAEPIVDRAEPWVQMVRRPFTLLEASIIGHWVDSEHAGTDLDFHLDRILAIQDAAGMATTFCAQRAMEAGLGHVRDLDRRDRARLIALLEHGYRVFERSEARLRTGEPFPDLDAAAEFLIEVGKYTVYLPAWTLLAIEGGEVDHPRVDELAQGLRARSLYPRVAHGLVAPLVERYAREQSFPDAERAAELLTWREVRARSLERTDYEARLAAAGRGERFVYQILGRDERVRFVAETGYLLMRQAGMRQIVPPDDPDQIAGQAAWPGIHRGRARVVLSSNPEGYRIEDGEVLISIQSNPNLMPLLRHAGAIVTDEGGVACHAGIICRELKIPTLIGTGRATAAIHDGDLVEVDATRQVVRILERARPRSTSCP